MAEASLFGELEESIRKGGKAILEDVALFDIYTGIGIAPGFKSVAFSLTLRAADRSLTAQEADDEIAAILKQLKEDLGAVLR